MNSIARIGPLLREKRRQRALREVAAEIGVSSATLSRVENGQLPDLQTFSKICRWLDTDPGAFLGYPTKQKRLPLKVLTYRLLTFLVIALSILRERICRHAPWELRKDRDERNLISGSWLSKDSGILLECCDCGLAHRLYEDKSGTHCIPQRPKEYDYKWRIGR